MKHEQPAGKTADPRQKGRGSAVRAAGSPLPPGEGRGRGRQGANSALHEVKERRGARRDADSPLPPGEGRGRGRRTSEALLQAALTARGRAYAPYSRFTVGAAVQAGRRVFAGANIENASYGLTLCAERVAVSTAALAGVRRLDAAVVASGTHPPTPPCGMCLQTLAEFAGPELPVVLLGDGERVDTTLGELLPRGFGKGFLAPPGARRGKRPRARHGKRRAARRPV